MKHILLCLVLSTLISAQAIETKQIIKLAKIYKLYAGSKASVQWERIFSSPRHLKRYKLYTLDSEHLVKLKTYLINHAADSAQPIVPGL